MATKNSDVRLTETVTVIEGKDQKKNATNLVKNWLVAASSQTKANVSAHMAQDGTPNKPKTKAGRDVRRALILLEVVRGKAPDAAKAEINLLASPSSIDYKFSQIIGEISTESNPHRANFARYSRLKLGINIGQEGHPGPGTIGLFVRCRRNGKVMLLSNMHVLRANNGPGDSTNILHPSQASGGRPNDVIAIYDRGVVSESIDSAVAYVVEKHADGLTNSFPEGLTLDAQVVEARLGLKVSKRGCSSRLSVGNVVLTNAQKKVSFKAELGGAKVMSNQIEIDGDNFQISGDSGSILFDQLSKGIVGLMHGGGKADALTGISAGGLACPIRAVLEALEVDLM